MYLQEVELLKSVNEVLDLYRSVYEIRYKTPPILSVSGADQTIVKDLIRQLGIEKCRELIEHYLKISEPWFLTKAHSLRALKDNLNLVNSKIIRTPTKYGGQKIRMKEKLACDSCWKYFDCTYDAAQDLQKAFIRCKPCLEKNAPWKYPTKEEFFNKKWQQMGADVPIYENIFKDKPSYPEGYIPLKCEFL